MSSTEYDREKGSQEHILVLPGGRELAYARNGPPTARIIILFFTGLMSVGNAQDVPDPCRKLQAQWIAPTLPGMGNSSIRADQSEPYHVAFARDIGVLLDHIYPTGDYDGIYLAGGSYGTVQAQMLYGADYKLFPAGRKILGCMLLAGFSPFHYNTSYQKSLTWHTWFSVGPPSQLLPFRLLQRFMAVVIGSKFKNLEGAKGFLNDTLFDRMKEDEKTKMAEYLARKGRTTEEFIENMAKGALACVSKTWEGFYEVSDVIHSDWGFNPSTLDDEHGSKPVLVVGSEEDYMGGGGNDWLMKNYKSATLRILPGGHISAVYHMDEIWEEMIGLVNPTA